MDIKSLLEEDGFTCKYIAETYGSAYSSPCPWCGGTDNSSVFFCIIGIIEILILPLI